jgi:hypothetical protein
MNENANEIQQLNIILEELKDKYAKMQEEHIYYIKMLNTIGKARGNEFSAHLEQLQTTFEKSIEELNLKIDLMKKITDNTGNIKAYAFEHNNLFDPPH